MPGRVSCLAFKANDLSCKEDWFGRLPKRGIQIGLKVHVIILIFSAPASGTAAIFKITTSSARGRTATATRSTAVLLVKTTATAAIGCGAA